MIKNFVVLFIFLLVISKYASAQLTLKIEITGLKNNNGLIMLQLFDENQNVIRQEKSNITENECLVIFKNLKSGRYGVRYFHDENLSGELETNSFGIPKEEYGFSNNAAGMFGPPSFDKWLFEIKEDKKLFLNPVK